MDWIPSHDPKFTDISFRHLEAGLARIHVLIQRQVRRWQLAGQDPNDTFRGLYVSDNEVNELLDRPLATNWGEKSFLDLEEAKRFSDELDIASLQVQSLVEMAHAQGQPLRLELLADICELDPFDLDAFLICAAPCLDLRYERIYGYLQDDVTRKHPGVNLVLDLLCEPGTERLARLAHFRDESPLFKHHLLERVNEPGGGKLTLLSQTLNVDESIIAWLLGDYRPRAEIRQFATLLVKQPEAINPVMPVEMVITLEETTREGAIGVFYGADMAGQESAARWMAKQVNRPLLFLDFEALVKAGETAWQPLEVLRVVLRDAHLTGAVPFLAKWEFCFSEGTPPADLLAELCAYPSTAILSGRLHWQAQGFERERRLNWLEFPIPDYPQRCLLWQHYLEQFGQEPQLNVDVIAGQYLLTSGQIRDAVATAMDWAAQRGEPVGLQDLLAAARAHSSARLSGLARKITPRYSWEDIILPADQLNILHELTATVLGRQKVLVEWGVGQKLASGSGVTVLFAGPPGTGKTMAAEIIAKDLGLDLYKIDLSTIVSKYIGETEKNLEHIFQEAEASNAILFFDEADALFGKRSEVRDSHDRYANIEISYLLQRMEAYEGVTILATNLRANLDEAFTRRLQFAVDFPFPDEAERLRIWQTLFPPEVPREPDIDLALLARRFKLAGGSIRNILVSAAYLAASDSGKVSMEHLLHSTRRELQKMGRLVGDEGA